MFLLFLLLSLATGLRVHSDRDPLELANEHTRTHRLGSRLQTTASCRSSVNPSGVDCPPNVLFLMTDQWNYPMPYETDEIKAWRKTHLKGETQLRANGFELHRHYVGSIACAPSRTTLFTGHYPSLHGVSQTDGMAKPLTDPRRWPLFPATVPTMGNYFRAGGYSTYYKGKWHVADSDIYIPGTRTAVHSYNGTGVPIPEIEKLYYNRLEEFGFSEWVGPEPHGASPLNSGFSAPCTGTGCYSGRDDVYTEELMDILGRLNRSYTAPFFLVGSLLGVHDIVLYGDITKTLTMYNFPIDSSVPSIPAAPTANENLSLKPTCQADWKIKFPQALQPTTDDENYRKFYYSLALKQDANLKRVLDVVTKSVFAENTIIVWTSDHGEYLGAHGLRAKWFSGYEEVTHVPCLFQIPSRLRFSNPTGTQILSSHVDLLPTLLGLTKLPQEQLRAQLALTFADAQPLVGRDLSSLITGKVVTVEPSPVIWLQIEDQILTGTNQVSPVTGVKYKSVIQPASVQAVLAYVGQKLYKYVRYYDNIQWWTNPSVPYDLTDGVWRNETVPDQYELYDITEDPTEIKNLLGSPNSSNNIISPATKEIQKIMKQHLTDQCNTKRLKPSHAEPGYPPGWMSCV